MTPDKQMEGAREKIDHIADSQGPWVLAALDAVIAHAQERRTQVQAAAEAALHPPVDPS